MNPTPQILLLMAALTLCGCSGAYDQLRGHKDSRSGAGADEGLLDEMHAAELAAKKRQRPDALSFEEAFGNEPGCLRQRLSGRPATSASIPHIEVGFDATRVCILSTKDLSNVVLEFADGTRQRFEVLSGQAAILAGTGANAGEEVVTVWVKSGSNHSGDGPGYGERFKRPASTINVRITDFDGHRECTLAAEAFPAAERNARLSACLDSIGITCEVVDPPGYAGQRTCSDKVFQRIVTGAIDKVMAPPELTQCLIEVGVRVCYNR